MRVFYLKSGHFVGKSTLKNDVLYQIQMVARKAGAYYKQNSNQLFSKDYKPKKGLVSKQNAPTCKYAWYSCFSHILCHSLVYIIVPCQRSGVSEEPPWHRAMTRHGPVTLLSVYILTDYLDLFY